MSIFNVIILTAVISTPTGTQATSTNRAIDATLKSIYIQNGYDKRVKKLEKIYTPKYIKERPWIVYGIKILTDQRISFQWSF